jgi:excinuclease ABC subunit B
VAILDADKEGFLRSETSLIQTIGRAARNLEGHVIMYADQITPSMNRAISETNRRRGIQAAYNKEHHITPSSVKKDIRAIIEATRVAEEQATYEVGEEVMDIEERIKKLEVEMLAAAEALEFEQAAKLRDEIHHLKQYRR